MSLLMLSLRPKPLKAEIRRARDLSLSKINRMETAKMRLEFRALKH